jgi:PAS domain S-box-containing protein
MMVSKLNSLKKLPYEQSIKILNALNEDSIVAITDKNGTITYANKKFCELSKYPLSELIGKNHRILKSGFHPPEFYHNMWNTINQGKIWKGNVKNKAKDNSFYWVKTTIFPIVDNNGKISEYISIRVDITEQIKKQEQLNKSLHFLAKSKFLTNMYENSIGLFRTVDIDGYIIECNQSYVDSLGYTKDEIIGQSIYDHTSEESINDLRKTFQKWKTTGNVTNSEIFLRRKDGTAFPVSLSANNMYDNKGNLIGSNTILQDISEMYYLRKQKEEHENMIAFQLEALQKLSKQKDEFLAMITHELKTPLVPIIGYTDLLLSQKFGELTEKQQSSLSSISINSKSLLRLISDLLDLQKLDLGTFKFEKNNFILSDLIQECLHQISPEFNDKNIEIIQNIETNLHCYCDSGRIKQTIFNLLTNAIDFCPKSAGQIIISLKHEENAARIIIKDNGIGIVESELSKIFTKFYQVNSSLTRVHGGTGLGLSICKAIITNHGGQIFAESSGKDKGAEIHVILPLVDIPKASELCEDKICHACNKEMILDEGDITFDARWFHCRCWNSLQNKI